MSSISQANVDGYPVEKQDIDTICLAILYIKNAISPRERHAETIEAASKIQGVESAERSPSKASLVMVRYDRNQT